MNIPEKTLNQLRCSLCEDHLSHLPVTVSIKDGQSKSICGRCPRIDDDNAVQQNNRAYELLAEHVNFPCKYSKSGCREKHVPSRMINHEIYCAYKEIFCPHIPLGSCPWQGSKDELLAHFEDKHSFLVIENGIFEVETATKYEENYVMQIKRELYVVLIKYNGDDGILWCNVQYLGSSLYKDKYKFQLSFYEIDDGVKVEPDAKIIHLFDSATTITDDVACIVNIEELMKALVNPTVIQCKINVQVNKDYKSPLSQLSTGKSSTEASRKVKGCHGISDEHLMDYLQHFECPTCMSYMYPPILQCLRGHSICEACRKGVAVCPTCREKINDTRNYALEKIVVATDFPCKNREDGCPFAGKQDSLNKHELVCRYSIPCPLTDCKWHGQYDCLMPHLRDKHDDLMLDTDQVTYYYTKEVEVDCEMYLLHKYDTLFKLSFEKDGHGDHRWAVQLIDFGSENEYVYEIELNDGHESILLRKKVPEVTKEAVFDNDTKYFELPDNMMKPFRDAVCMSYTIRIIEI